MSIKDSKYSNQMACFHMTVESFDLRTKVRCARTYFLAKNVKFYQNLNNILNDDNVPQDYDLTRDPNASFKDEEQMLNLYIMMILGMTEVF
jgi:hypothetical protein